MSPRLPVVEARDLVRVARKLGFELDRQKATPYFAEPVIPRGS